MVNITSPYEYKELKRTSVDGKRLYENPYGEPVPSVTTILDKTKPREKMQALANWKKRVGAEKAQQIVTEAANVGTVMHAILENYVLNKEYDPGNNIWGSEVNLCFPQLYAGTTDLVGVWKGKPAIMDFKQTNKPKKREWIDDYFLQGAAYALAHNAMFETKIENIAIFMCSRAGEWQLFEVEADEFPKWELAWARRLEQFYNI
jgi:genome maintenance exonuclease 1